MAYLLGTDASETINGTPGDDTIAGNGGDDSLNGGFGNDALYGYSGNDVLSGGDGDDWLGGQDGDDLLLGGDGEDRLNGNDGADTLDGGAGADTLTIAFDTWIDSYKGGAGADLFTLDYYYPYGELKSTVYLDHVVDFSAAEGDRLGIWSNQGKDPYTDRYFVWNGEVTTPGFNLTVGQELQGGIGAGFLGLWTWSNAGKTYLIVDRNGSLTLDNFDYVLAFDNGVVLDKASFSAGTFTAEVGTPGNDSWTGTLNSDLYFGGAGDDIVSGQDAPDELHGGDGADTLNGGDDGDVLIGDFGNDTLHGNGGNDSLYAGARYNGFEDSSDSVNVLYGEGGNDFLMGSNGHDTLYGGDDDDNLLGGPGDKLYGGDGDDYVSGGAAELYGEAGDDVLTLTAGVLATGGSGADKFLASFSTYGGNPDGGVVADFNATEGDRLDFGPNYYYSQPIVWRGAVDNPDFSMTIGQTFSPNDYGQGFIQMWTWNDGAGGTYLIVDGNGDGKFNGDYAIKFVNPVGLDASAVAPNFLMTPTGTNGVDTFNGGAGNETYYGVNGDDLLHGGDGQDKLYGNKGDDQLWGDGGDDEMNGGAGVDVIDGGVGLDKIYGGGGSDTLHGGDGNDTLYAADPSIVIDDPASTVDVLYGDAGDDQLNGSFGLHDKFYGGDGKDTIYGNGELYGEAGDDTLVSPHGGLLDGGAGDDYLRSDNEASELFGRSGADYLIGGQGADILHLDLGDKSATGGAANDLLYIDGLTGGETQHLTYIAGDQGDDTFVFLRALDNVNSVQLAGGSNYDGTGGSDLIDFSHAQVAVRVELGYGAAQQTGMGLLSLSEIENLLGGDYGVTFIGNVSANKLTGGLGNDWLDGGQGADTLLGGGGADVLIGGLGADALDGGTGADAMTGGLGDDAYWVDDAGDQVKENAGEGIDTVTSSLNYTLGGAVENLTLGGGASYGVGNGLANILTGNALSNTLDGGAGADTMAAGLGDDAYWVDDVGDVVRERADEGFDTIASLVSYTLGDNVEKLLLLGSAINATGNSGGNILVGNALANTLDAGASGDILDGGVGADTMIGGTGDDSYWVDNTGDRIIEQAGQGFDTVASFVSYGLSDNVEKLILLGSAGYGVGSAQTNILVGNALDNTLDGGAGADWMEGGAGADAYWVDNAGDTVIELVGEGFDTIASTVSYTLAANVEKLLLLGSALTATGNSGGNILVGNALANTLDAGGSGDILDGGTGADTMIGGTGDDSYWVDDAGDAIVELVGEGFETVASFVSYTLAANVEKLILLGTATAATGSAQTNILVGNALGNTINGLGGDDWLEGGAGVDHFVFGPGAGHDRIVDFGLGGEHDVLDLSAYVTASVTWSVTQQGADTLVAFANGDSVLLADTLQAHVVQNGGELVWT
jgi:Ca2+-binding RTX toxin-like protein